MKTTKKTYHQPSLKVVMIEATDIIATSGDMTKASLQSMEQEDW